MKNLEISPELQIEINRAKWIQALQENGHRQCIFWGGDSVHVCALELVEEVAEFDDELEHPFTDQHDRAFDWLGIDNHNFAKRLRATGIYDDNDAGWTFAQIADAVIGGRYW